MEFNLTENADLVAELSKLSIIELYQEVERIEARQKQLRNRKYWVNEIKALKEREAQKKPPAGPTQTIQG